jgi:hypothetical protein
MEIIRDLSLIGLGYIAAEASAYFKWRRDRRDRTGDREYHERERSSDEEERRRSTQIDACVAFLTAAHQVAVGSSLKGWEDAHITAMESLSRIRLLMPPDIALSAGRLHNAAISSPEQLYETVLADFINKLRTHFGQDIIKEFKDFV